MYYKDKSFYSEIAKEIPAGALEVTEEQYQEIREGLLNGKVLREDENGFPYAEDVPVKQVRIFSKYKLCDTTIDMPFTLADGTETTVWEAFKSFITAAGKKDLWDNIIEVAEDNRHFQQAIPIAIENFGKELVDQILTASVERTETRVVEE